MPIQQTLVGLENNFAGRASVLSRTISADDELGEDESSWLMLGAPFPMRSVRVHNRARSETALETDVIEDIVQREIQRGLPAGTDVTREVSIGAMYTDDLPISGHRYSNVFIVVSFDLRADIPLPRDAHISVEMYFGWRAAGRALRVSDDWYHRVEVRHVGPARRRAVRDRVDTLLTRSTDGPSVGEQLRDGLRLVFDRDGVRNWYVIPGGGGHDSQDSDVTVRQDASFFVVG